MLKCYNEIIPNLFLGDQYSTGVVHKDVIDHIFSIGAISKSREIPNTHTQLKDSKDVNIEDNLDYILPIMHEMMENKKRILVHCKAGINRGPCFVMAYLCKYKNMSVEQAEKLILSKRKICKFLQKKQVEQYLKNDIDQYILGE